MKLDEAVQTLKDDEEGLRGDAGRLNFNAAETGRRPCEIRRLDRDRDIALNSAEAIRVVLAKLAEAS